MNLADTRLNDSFMASPDYLANSGKKGSAERAMSARSYTIRTAIIVSCSNSDLEGHNSVQHLLESTIQGHKGRFTEALT